MLELGVGLLVMSFNGFIHGLVLASTGVLLERLKWWAAGQPGIMRQTSAMTCSIVIVMAAHFSGVFVWTAVFLALEILSELEEALYFSIVAYTTLGFGDIILDEPWRILSGMIAANGFLLFGWSTAFQIEYLNQLRDAADATQGEI